MELLTEHFGELVVGFVLSIFAWAFSSWSGTVKKIAEEFAKYRLDTERRLIKLEIEIHELSRLCEENKKRHDEHRQRD